MAFHSGKKRDLSIISPGLPTVLKISPRTKGMPKNLSNPVNISVYPLSFSIYHHGLIRTCTGFTSGGLEWPRPKMHPTAITKTNILTNTRLPMCKIDTTLLP